MTASLQQEVARCLEARLVEGVRATTEVEGMGATLDTMEVEDMAALATILPNPSMAAVRWSGTLRYCDY